MIAHNKGKRFIKCKECNKKRYCSRIPAPNISHKYTCSKDHSWIWKDSTTERVVAFMKDLFTEYNLSKLFDRDDIFYKTISRR